ncbi:zinc finger BED domain-containing protein RICESLEEPER 2-like [Humulus lupulus]|uniref:zinc finger BED domain-containing protein RICESLEEPER 2-like n=1 Tax=Humulus lupulus TaxID=3486 RepID=UPI002B4164F0|nr:zinc finger BED domain-containing protein RICESLEEPER 2-like [Humulus lupulus]
MVDHSGFIDYSNTISPMFQMVSKNTIRSDILKIYKIEKEKFREVLEKNKSRIALTTDMWTANHQKRGYMTVTSHFIDDSWKLHSQIISFKYVSCPHDAPTLTETLSSCMSEWNIEHKISTMTVGNCTTNDAMIPLLNEQFDSKCFLLNGKLLHMCCCAHILNLIVRDGLSVIGDSIDKIQDSVAYWSGTPKRYEKFEDTARLLGVTCTKKLSLDCVTRWNSTYLMLKTALFYKKVFEQSKLRDPKYKCLPSENDWIRAQKLCDKLEVVYEMKIEAWMTSDEFFIKNMATQMMSKFQKYWEEIHGLMTVAVVLDPRSQQLDNASASFSTQDDLSNYDTYVIVASGAESVKSKLDAYLDEKVLPRTGEFFDICNYWKVIGFKYPMLNKIARDIFVVSISTVASESAFSTGSRHVGSHLHWRHWSVLKVGATKLVTINDEDNEVDPTMDPYIIDLED